MHGFMRSFHEAADPRSGLPTLNLGQLAKESDLVSARRINFEAHWVSVHFSRRGET